MTRRFAVVKKTKRSRVIDAIQEGMKDLLDAGSIPSAEEIARKAEKGQDISRHFTNKGKMMPAVRKTRRKPGKA